MAGRPLANMLLGIYLGLAWLACELSGAPLGASSSLQVRRLEHGGVVRTYWLAVPDRERLRSPAALILALHGGGGTALGECRMPGGLRELAEEGAFILVCPQGIEGHWNDGRPTTRWRAHAQKVDDLGFLAAVVEDVARQLPVDGQRVFATGISNGGLMSFRLACERADLVRGVAAVAASMLSSMECQPSQPVSILILNGTEDPLVPYEGGDIGFGRAALGRVLPTESALRRWAELDGCMGPPAEEALRDRFPDDGTEVWRLSYAACAGESQVELYRIEGGGHTWPQGPQYLPVSLVGKVTREIHGGEAIWDFFASPAAFSEPQVGEAPSVH